MEELELKPCPFCGVQPRLFTGYFGDTFFYKCDNVKYCDLTVNTFIKKTKEEAAIIWNKRI